MLPKHINELLEGITCSTDKGLSYVRYRVTYLNIPLYSFPDRNG